MKLAKHASREWALLERFLGSEVKDQGHSDTKCTFAAEASLRRCGIDAHLFSEYSRWQPRTRSGNIYQMCRIQFFIIFT